MPTSVHAHPEEWLAAALADGLSDEERRTLDAHLAGCERCRALQAEFAALDGFLRHELPAAAGPRPGFEARLVGDFRRRAERRAPWTRLRSLAAWLLRQRAGQLAAVATVLLGLVGLWQLLTRGGFAPPSSRRPVPRGGAVQSDLADKVSEPAFISSKDQTASSLVQDFAMLPVGESAVGRDKSALDKKAARPTSRTDAVPGSPDRLGLGVGVTGTLATTATTEGSTQTEFNPLFTGTSVLPALTLLDGRRIGDVQSPRSIALDAKEGETISNPPASGSDPTAAAPPTSTDVRKLVRNAHVELEVAAFDAAVDAVSAAATRDGGFLDTRNSARGANGKVSGTLVVKVLPENLDRFLTGLRALGDIKNQTVQTEDVTKDYYDTDARLRNARRLEDRLLKMLDEVKGKMSEVLGVEKELARVRADVETLQGQLKLYDAQVRLATVTLSIYEKDLRQPAAFLLRETATLALLVPDVEKTAADVRRIADTARAQTARSETTRDPAGRSRATLRLLIAPEAVDGVLAQIKALGRVENYRVQSERVAQNGVADNASVQDPARVERAPVTLELTVSHDEQVSRQVSLAVVAADVERAFERARTEATTAGGEIVQSNLAREAGGHVTATLGVRVPAAAEAALVAAWRTLGRAGDTDTRRVGNDPGEEGGPTLLTLTLTDVEPVVQQTTVRVLVDDAERRAAEIKREAAAAHATVEASDFAAGSNGEQRTGLQFRLASKDYLVLVERVRALGVVKDFTVQRHDRPDRNGGEASQGDAPVSIELTLYREGCIVDEGSGWGATWRRTFGQGAGALAWSVRMIGVAVAFLAPWALVVLVVFVARWWMRRLTKATPTTDDQP